ncbi:ABC transporter ATP-binding protein [Dysgonomonas macrotermitis]|uniref:ABC-2 type transport system ATP-binding protein n=1 Tax=Dysgonomonas macrotermitis TaxID=1346286 RepID=A0A1M5G4H1_9BACT|nr:ABC transporter ATP-binding protein [Dysgonomonas macrotermitis]SHF98697.1 ABC-2 type transport system ATP-binding protein [Dysgonomonas macrotermitis]
MQLFDTYYKEIYNLLEYDDYPNLLKRIIDLTLDTEDLVYYKKAADLLDWLELNQNNIDEINVRFKVILEDLYNVLSKKEIKKRKYLLEVNELVKGYPNSAFALGPISFTISEGEIIGLVGENGNGKTTLLRSLCGELAITGGSVKYIFERENSYDLRTKLIYIPQRTKDWHGSLLSNLQFTASSYGILGEENEHLVQLVIARMGLRGYRHLNWKSLSSGYKMRFELARMLLRKPHLLLIDEPLANLDILAQQVVLDDFRNIAKSLFRPLGVVLSSQQLYEVEKTSDRVIFLKQGKPQSVTNTGSDASLHMEDDAELIIEFESDWGQEPIREALTSIGLLNLQLKGGTYIAIFPSVVSQEQFLQLIIDKHISLTYFRNISNSTRRFFL